MKMKINPKVEHSNKKRLLCNTVLYLDYIIVLGSEIDQLIDENSSDQIILNIVKCHFDATVDDVKAAFPNHKFVEV
jgi:hypothetical protein